MLALLYDIVTLTVMFKLSLQHVFHPMCLAPGNLGQRGKYYKPAAVLQTGCGKVVLGFSILYD